MHSNRSTDIDLPDDEREEAAAMKRLMLQVKCENVSPDTGAVLVASTSPPAEDLWDESLHNDGLRHIPALWFAFDMPNPKDPLLTYAGLADLTAWVIRLAEEEDEQKRLSTRNRNCLAFMLRAGMEVNTYREGWVSLLSPMRPELMSFQSETQKWNADACKKSRPKEYTAWFKEHCHCKYKAPSPKFPDKMWCWLELILDLSDEEEPRTFWLNAELHNDARGETWPNVSPTGPYCHRFLSHRSHQ
jgi:hypothetical protein